jgi:hypothetical protein
MKKIIKPRQAGKTTRLIDISAATGTYILTANRRRAVFVADLAHKQKKNIPFPVTVNDFRIGGFRGTHVNRILIDDADAVLQEIFGIRIEANTMTADPDDEMKKLTIWQRVKEWFGIGGEA